MGWVRVKGCRVSNGVSGLGAWELAIFELNAILFSLAQGLLSELRISIGLLQMCCIIVQKT